MSISRRETLKLLAAAGAAPLVPGLGATSLSARAAAGPHTFKVGNFEVTVISDGSYTLPLSFMLPTKPREEVERLLADHNSKLDGGFPAQVNVTVVKTPDAVVMIDAGAGPDFVPGVGFLADNIERAGIAPDSITHIVFTHAHPDHLWGVIDPLDGGTRFAKARHVMSGPEHDFWVQPGAEAKVPEVFRNFAPGITRHLKTLGEKMERVKAGTELIPGVALVDTAGHTPGHMSVLLKSGTEQLLIGGDVVTNAIVSFAKPDWPWGPDMDRDKGVAARKRTLDMLATDKIGLVGYHLPWPGLARVEKKDTAYRYVAG